MDKLYRAHSSKYLTGNSGTISNPNFHRVRRPRDTPVHLHQIICAWFIERFGISYRELSLFCTGNRIVAEGYQNSSSTVISLAPIGTYSVCFSEECKDLFAHCQFIWIPRGAGEKEVKSDLDSFEYKQVINGGICDAARTGNEVMVYATHFSYVICSQSRGAGNG